MLGAGAEWYCPLMGKAPSCSVTHSVCDGVVNSGVIPFFFIFLLWGRFFSRITGPALFEY